MNILHYAYNLRFTYLSCSFTLNPLLHTKFEVLFVEIQSFYTKLPFTVQNPSSLPILHVPIYINQTILPLHKQTHASLCSRPSAIISHLKWVKGLNFLFCQGFGNLRSHSKLSLSEITLGVSLLKVRP